MTIYRDDELYARGDFDEAHDQRLRDRRNLKHASPIPPRLDESTIRAIRKLPELLMLAREVARQTVEPDMLCHVGLVPAASCARCGPILAAQKLVDHIDKGD